MIHLRGRLRISCFFLAFLMTVSWSAVPLLAVDTSSQEEEVEHGEELEQEGNHVEHSSRLSDEYIPLQLENFPERPRLLIELGNPYLGTGRISPGKKLPTGAVWQPTLIVFGTLRTAVQSFEAGDTRFTEWANRLDLFANLQLSGSERLVIGFRNFDQEGRFSGYIFDPDPDDPAFQARYGDEDEFRDELNAEIQSLYFEGDFGEIFPHLDKQDFGRTDVGFSIGRQPLFFQEGMLINDSIDGVGVTRNTLQPNNTSNFRATFFSGVGDVHRANREDDEAELYALLTSTDLRRSTIDADIVYVAGGSGLDDLIALGVSAVQRIGKVNTSFRILGSMAVDEESLAARDGVLLFSEVSWTPHHSDNLIYVNTFLALEDFTSAARGPATGGPLGRAGITFAAAGLGNFGAPLSSIAREVVGGAIGYQKFIGPAARRQVLSELGVRVGTSDAEADSAAAMVRFQQALGRRFIVVTDGFASYQDLPGLTGDSDTFFGGRLELVLKF